VSALEHNCPLKGASVFRKGEAAHGRPNARQNETSGLTIELTSDSAAFADLAIQQLEVLAVLNKHLHNWKLMRSTPGLEIAVLDFGIEMRNVAAQFDQFTQELVQAAAAVGASLELSQYPPERLKKWHVRRRRTLRNLFL
jgi:hypothetical protein